MSDYLLSKIINKVNLTVVILSITRARLSWVKGFPVQHESKSEKFLLSVVFELQHYFVGENILFYLKFKALSQLLLRNSGSGVQSKPYEQSKVKSLVFCQCQTSTILTSIQFTCLCWIA